MSGLRVPVISLGLLPFWGDPAPGVFRSRQASRNLQCERLTQTEAYARHQRQGNRIALARLSR